MIRSYDYGKLYWIQENRIAFCLLFHKYPCTFYESSRYFFLYCSDHIYIYAPIKLYTQLGPRYIFDFSITNNNFRTQNLSLYWKIFSLHIFHFYLIFIQFTLSLKINIIIYYYYNNYYNYSFLNIFFFLNFDWLIDFNLYLYL